MICVQLNGGLGNQMFQYACGRALAYRSNSELILDTSQIRKRLNGGGSTFRSYDLNIFKINARKADIADIKKLKPTYLRVVNVILLHTLGKGIQTTNYFVEKDFSYNQAIERIGNDCILIGYWQSSRYFQNIESLIRKEFSFPEIQDEENRNRVTRIEHENSVSLHIRRTDFVNNKYHDIHGTCSLEYYKGAIKFITDKVTSPYFYIFSDDLEWARSNLNLTYPYEFVSGNTGKQSYIDMHLISLCKHNIIANSSFSWWGAWLNQNPDKIIIAPERWFKDSSKNTDDLIPESWIRL
jgi:hypothetical protein